MSIDDIINTYEENKVFQSNNIEHTGNREGDLYFSNLIRDVRKKGFIATDVDFTIYNINENRLAFFEIKTYNSEIKQGQGKVFELLDKIMKQQNEVQYLGYYLVTFENNTFENGNVYISKPYEENFEKMPITKDYLLNRLRNKF